MVHVHLQRHVNARQIWLLGTHSAGHCMTPFFSAIILLQMHTENSVCCTRYNNKKFETKKAKKWKNRSDLSLFLFDSSGCVLILLFDSARGAGAQFETLAGPLSFLL